MLTNILEEELNFDNINSLKNEMKIKHWVDGNGNNVPTSQLTDDQVRQNQFKVISYNILGPLHGEGLKHDYAPVSVTKWTRRRDHLIEEMVLLNPDVLCLQEVSAKSLKETFIPGLKRIGLECGAYAPTKFGQAQSGKYGHRNIGCAIFYKPARTSLESSRRVHLKDYVQLDQCRSHEYYSDIHYRGNSMAMVQLKLISNNQTFVVGNTHLYWNPKREDIKTSQTQAVGAVLSKFSHELGYDHLPTESPRVILCGDFNCLPDILHDEMGSFHSAPFELLTTGRLPTSHPHHPDQWFLSQVNTNSVCPRLGDLSIDWKFQNVYEIPEYQDHRPLFTTKTDEFQGWIDHIWINQNSKLSVSKVLSPPVRNGDLMANSKSRLFEPIPNRNFPSDHIPIGMLVDIID